MTDLNREKCLSLLWRGGILLLLAVGAFLRYWLGGTCPVARIFGISCPGCGLTRAVLAALRLDFAEAFSQHFMFFSLPVLCLYFLFDGRVFRNRTLNAAVLWLIVGGFAVHFLLQFLPL